VGGRRSGGLPVADSSRDSAPICALMRGRYSCPIRLRFRVRSRPCSVAIRARLGWGCCRPGAPWWGWGFLAVLRTGWRGDTSPLEGCCARTAR